ncbi:hypothetical protein [Neisseria sp.]|uniref:hypothetical protein n=1 Tax=Neisseria sp. TaxID=192066 RepID=UPI0035A04ACC
MLIYKFSTAILTVFLCSNACGVSKSPYPDGNVDLIIKNNELCAYINKENLSGNYILGIYHHKKEIISKNQDHKTSESNYEYWGYENSFSNHYPSKNNCIPINKTTFPEFNLKNGEEFGISLVPNNINYIPDNFDGFSGSYCFKNKNGKIEIQDYFREECVDRKLEPKSENYISTEHKENWIDRLINWLKKLWS